VPSFGPSFFANVVVSARERLSFDRSLAPRGNERQELRALDVCARAASPARELTFAAPPLDGAGRAPGQHRRFADRDEIVFEQRLAMSGVESCVVVHDYALNDEIVRVNARVPCARRRLARGGGKTGQTYCLAA
jgi:hypothetical protein